MGADAEVEAGVPEVGSPEVGDSHVERLVPVRPGLWQAPAPTPSWDGTYLDNPGVRYDLIVSLTRWGSDSPHGALRQGGRFVWVPMVDGPEVPATEIRLLAAEIAEALRGGAEVLVHCDAGLNRSGVVVGRTLLELGSPVGEAISAIRAARGPSALCNPWFVRWLEAEASTPADRAPEASRADRAPESRPSGGTRVRMR